MSGIDLAGVVRKRLGAVAFEPGALGNAVRDHHMSGMKNLELSEDEAAGLIRVLRKVSDDDRYPLSQRVQMLQTILDRLEPPAARPAAAPDLGCTSRRREGGIGGASDHLNEESVMPNSGPPVLPPLIDNPLAPEFFADEATGFFVHQGNLSITFSSARVDHRSNPGPVSRVVVGRVVLPIAAAAGLAVELYDFLKKMGIDPASLGPDETAH